MVSRRELLPFGLLVARCVQAAVRSRAAFLTYDQVASALTSCGLAAPSRSAWHQWIQSHDAAIRSRIRRGEEDSLVNLVLFGVSFTTQPRVTPEDTALESFRAAPSQSRFGTTTVLPNRDRLGAAMTYSIIDARVRDFVRALGNPGGNERLVWLRNMLQPRQRTESWVKGAISRYLAEQGQYRAVLNNAPAGDRVTSQLFKDRGLSVDTNFRPNWAIEQTLADLKRRGALTNVRRAAIIGPGLDFTDKDYGFDYYPLQTLQPFGLADSLIRLGLAHASDLRVGVFDISTQPLDHITRAIRSGRPYTIQLVLDELRAWNPDAMAYWRRFGDRIGTSVEPMSAPPQVRSVLPKAVEIRPDIVRLLEPAPLNIVTQRPDEQYDLVVATNILVYYDTFDQALASLNIQAMMSLGGIFLANSSLPQCAGGNLHPIGNVDVRYSSAPGDDDRIEIYSNARFARALGPQ
ncbi:MAG TPA: hypothetical protein VHY84_11460 [Bryobacteraceae bacterium]|nr:hypothetical protein [Bryobacteraceae bacterium]